MVFPAPEYLASRKWSYRKPDGTIVDWQQEDESAVTSKAEAVAMIQRTLDFWIPALAYKLGEKIPMEEAKRQAKESFRSELEGMLSKPFPKRWGITIEDFTFPELKEMDN